MNTSFFFKKVSMVLFLSLLIIVYLTLSCKNNNSINKENIIKNFIGKTIDLPDSLLLLKNNKIDTINIDRYNSDTQIISFIDGRCKVCVNKLLSLIEAKRRLNKEVTNVPEYLFIVYSENYNYFMEKFYPLLNHSQPILLLSDISFLEQKQLPGLGSYKTFLTINDTIRVVGNPSGNKELTNLYKKVINKH